MPDILVNVRRSGEDSVVGIIREVLPVCLLRCLLYILNSYQSWRYIDHKVYNISFRVHCYEKWNIS